MGYYMLFVSVVCLSVAIWLLITRLRFRANASIYQGSVIDLVTINRDGLSNGGRNKHLLIEYFDNHERREFLCEDAVIAAFYHINDNVEVLVGGEGKHQRVRINNVFSLAVPSIVLTIIGLGSLLGANSIFGWWR
ncbi:MAG: hypothetical protein VX100_10490 [Pseudomonadota bacterium]|nr:hypothetical protein [Pseudomonadota bacterium]